MVRSHELIFVVFTYFICAVAADSLAEEIADVIAPTFVEREDSVENMDTSGELNVMELELFSKLLSPNDTTLQQGSKSLLAKYIIAQILSNKRNNGKQPAPSPPPDPAAPANNAQQVPVIVPVTNPPANKSPPTRGIAVAENQKPAQQQQQQQPIIIGAPDFPLPPVRVTPAPAHVLNQVDKILGNVATGNVIGIVDESLAIRAPQPVRSLVNGILKLVFCNPVDRLMNRCRGSGSSAGALPAAPSPQAAGLGGTRRPIFG